MIQFSAKLLMSSPKSRGGEPDCFVLPEWVSLAKILFHEVEKREEMKVTLA